VGAGVLLIDNYDSFTYNLAQALMELGASVEVHRNDMLDAVRVRELEPTHLVISPGPGIPERAGCTLDILRSVAEDLPVLGVCLGHQALAVAFGGQLRRAQQLVHGAASAVYHDRRGIYTALPNPLPAGRYHSWVVDEGTLPPELEVVAFTSEGEVMGLRHRTLPLEGVQFHPESVLTPQGQQLLRNFLEGR
jgi:anthranilate synthase/aminodeoxychorismate synthase-like glutamine amidotransferase